MPGAAGPGRNANEHRLASWDKALQSEFVSTGWWNHARWMLPTHKSIQNHQPFIRRPKKCYIVVPTILYPANLAYAVAQRAAEQEKDGTRSVSMGGPPGFGCSKEKVVVWMKELEESVNKQNTGSDQIEVPHGCPTHSSAFNEFERSKLRNLS